MVTFDGGKDEEHIADELQLLNSTSKKITQTVKVLILNFGPKKLKLFSQDLAQFLSSIALSLLVSDLTQKDNANCSSFNYTYWTYIVKINGQDLALFLSSIALSLLLSDLTQKIMQTVQVLVIHTGPILLKFNGQDLALFLSSIALSLFASVTQVPFPAAVEYLYMKILYNY